MLLLALMAVCPAPMHSNGSPPPPTYSAHATQTSLRAEIDALLGSPALRGGIQGVRVESLETGAVLYERNPDLFFLPASNQKLLVSAAALDQLGPNFRWKTELLRDGQISNGVLTGNLYLRGSGDATLGVEDLRGLAEEARRLGLRRVVGRVAGDASRFDGKLYGYGWEWDDLRYPYAAPVSALCLNRNVVRVTVHAGSNPGDPAIVDLDPHAPCLEIENRAVTGESGVVSAIRLETSSTQDRLTVTGTLAPGSQEGRSIPVRSPARFAASVFTHLLRDVGIQVDGEAVEATAPPDAVLLAAHESRRLAETLPLLNKPSDNLLAECLLRTLGAESGRGGTASAAIARAMEWLREIGTPEGSVDMADGSGLSRHNGVTPRALATLLRHMHRHPLAAAFRESLPIAGVDGTLRNRMKGTPAEGVCRAKTGTLSGVSSLSGYVPAADGTPLLFVILMNNHRAPAAEATAIQDRIVALLAGTRETRVGKSGEWAIQRPGLLRAGLTGGPRAPLSALSR